MSDGGYDIGYKTCTNFWGDNPGSLILKLEDFIVDYKKLKVLDLGCGEAKNAAYLAKKGCLVEAYDISDYAIYNAKKKTEGIAGIMLEQSDVKKLNLKSNHFDIVISYGLFHCFETKKQVNLLIENCMKSLVKGGYFIVCAFNSRNQDLSAHPGFYPLLLKHEEYFSYFKNHKIIVETDEDLTETHPHNRIPHTHSMTRMIIQKI